MYRPQHESRKVRRVQHPKRGALVQMLRRALPALTTVFWVAAAILVLLMALPSFIGGAGAWLHWMTGMTLLVVVACSGAIAWSEFKDNPSEEAERGEWTNKMLFYGLVFAISFFVAFLYWLTIYFAMQGS